MFCCEKCKRVVGPGQIPVRKVVKVVEVEHPAREYVGRHGETIRDPGGRGPQIVEEIVICSECDKEMS